MQTSPTRFNLLPEVIKNLLIINGLLYLASVVIASTFQLDLTRILGLYLPGSPMFRPYQLVSHMFMHSLISFDHILMNMFALWMFGTSLENLWGAKRFLIYYMATGFGAAAIHLGWSWFEAYELQQALLAQGASPQDLSSFIAMGPENFNPRLMGVDPVMLHELQLKYYTPTVGASGAVFGVLLAFGMMFPNAHIYLYFLIPIKAKYLVAILGAIELYSGFMRDPSSNVAHFAHLGGMLFGYLLIRFWRKRRYR